MSMRPPQTYADLMPTASKLRIPGVYDVDTSLTLSAAAPRSFSAGGEHAERTPLRSASAAAAAKPFTRSLATSLGGLSGHAGGFHGSRAIGGGSSSSGLLDMGVPAFGSNSLGGGALDMPRSGAFSPRRHHSDVGGLGHLSGLPGSMDVGATFGAHGSDRALLSSTDLQVPVSAGALDISASGVAASSSALLQRRLVIETRNREACQLTVTKILRSVGIFRHQLHGVTNELSSGDPVVQARLRDLAEALSVEVGDTAALVGVAAGMPMEGLSQSSLVVGGVSPGNHDVLRHSLVETQRRCESLNVEMLRQMEMTEEVVASLNTAKDANRKLTDQIRQQAEEIASFAKRHVVDEQQFDDLRRKQLVEDDLREKDAQRRVATLEESAEARYQNMHRTLCGKLRAVAGKLEQLRRDTARLRDDQHDQRRTAGALVDNMRQSFLDAERTFMKQLDDHARNHSSARASSESTVRDFELRLAAERDLRMNEVSSWSNRHMILSTERDDLHARHTRDVGQLTAQLQNSEQSLQTERQTGNDRRARLHHECEELQLHRSNCETVIEQHRQNLSRLESTSSALDQNHQNSQQTVAELRQQLRESDDSLSLAVNGNEQLRAQMEEQRQRLTDGGDLALAQYQDAAEQRLLHVQEVSKVEIARTTELWRESEDQARSREVELGFLRAQEACVSEDVTSVRRELEHSRVQAETATNVKQVVEADLVETRKELADVRSRLQGTVDRLELQKSTLEAEVHSTSDRLRDVHRACGDRDAERGRHTDALEVGIKDRDARLEDKEKKLSEVREGHAEAAKDAASHSRRSQELQVALETLGQSSSEDRRRLEEECRRLEAAVGSASRLAQDGQSQYEQWRDAHMVSLRQLQDDGHSKHSTTEKERDSCRHELAEAARELSDARGRLEANEQEVLRVRYLLNESQSNVSFVKKEREREDHEHAETNEKLREEAMQVSGALEAAMRNEVALTQQLEAATGRYQQERMKAQRELEELKNGGEQQISDVERRVERLKAEYEGQMQSLDMRHREELHRERKAIDALAQENGQLRNFLSEHRRTSSADMNSLHSQLESHIGRLQRHTEELRGDLNRSAVVGLQPPPVLSSSVYGSARASALAATSPRLQVGSGGLPRTLAPSFEGALFRTAGDGGG